MKNFLISTALILSITVNANAGTDEPQKDKVLNSYCLTKRTNPGATNQDFDRKVDSLISFFDTSSPLIKPEESVACGAVLRDVYSKGLIGGRDRIEYMKITLKSVENTKSKLKEKLRPGTKYIYTGKISISDYRRSIDGYKKLKNRTEQVRGELGLLPVLPPVSIILPAPPPPTFTPIISTGGPTALY